MLAVTDALIVQQCWLTWSLVSATIPNIKGFLNSFSMDMGMHIPRDIRTDYLILGSSYELQTFSAFPTIYGESEFGHFRGDQVHHQVIITALDRDLSWAHGGSSLRKNGSQEMIIKKDVHWKVDHGPR